MDHYDVHDGVRVQGLQNSDLPSTEHPEKLRYQTLSLSIIEHRGVVFLIKNELKGVVVYELLYFLHQAV